MKDTIIKRITSGRYTAIVLQGKFGFTVEIYGGEAMMPYCVRRFDEKQDATAFVNSIL